MIRLQTILHPTDFSECSERAFELACSLAHAYGARLLLQHVTQPPGAVKYGAVVFPFEWPGERKALHDRLDALQSRASGIVVEQNLRTGDAAAQIIDLASQEKCDLIVMGTHGRSGLGHLILGSVAEQVVRKAPCAVLTVKPPPPAAADQSAGATKADMSHAILS